MSRPRGSSPFPTSHDSLGTSSLNTPHVLDSSPPGITKDFQPSNGFARRSFPDRTKRANATRERVDKSNARARRTSSSDGSDSEANLSDYTFDLDNLPGQVVGIDGKNDGTSRTVPEEEGHEENGESDPQLGGPPDFTLNMVELVRRGTSEAQQGARYESTADQKEEEQGHTMIPDEYSEFEPPLDMSTPAHVTARHKSANYNDALHKSTHPMRMFREGSSRVSPVAEEPDNENDDIRSEVERLRKELRDKDDIIRANQRRVLDAASVSEQVRHLQSELRRQSVLLNENEAGQNENMPQQEQIKQLRAEVESKNSQLQDNKTELDELNRLREEAEQLRKDTNGAQNGHDASSGELSFVRRQLEEKDKALEQTSSKFQETMTSHEKKLQEKVAEIERLNTQQDEQCLELDRLDSDLDSVMRERDELLKRTGELEEIVEQHQQQVGSLNSELAAQKKERDSDLNALRALTSELSIDSTDQQLPEIIISLKSAFKESVERTSAVEKAGSTDHKPRQANEAESTDVRLQLQEATSLTRILSQQLESTKDELEESKSLHSSAVKDNSQLKSQLEEATSSRSTLQDRLKEVTHERDEVVKTLQQLRAQLDASQNPTIRSPRQVDPSATQEAKSQEIPDAIHRIHRTELDKIQAAHNTTLSAIRDSYAEATQNLNSLLSAAQQREAELQSELTALRKTSPSQETELAALKAERDNLESVIEAKNAAAEAMDTKFASVLKKREEVWEARVERLMGDRELMGKVLMWTWGEMENGDGRKRDDAMSRKAKGSGRSERSQRYRYKHVQRETDMK